ncbi:hypothetical protein [Rhodopseudomonas sp. B29]|uniref:hypothetical protein n=1 Tax=Rhodopseudomonas sp. B29 TaxID=95607 RepID=UPI00131F38B9|nr:hypothetical protein [Rhodopseudomonas sp. B29]
MRMAASGMSEHEIAEADELAAATSKKYPALSQTSLMHMARNVRSIVGSYEEATKVLDPLAQLKVVALGAHPEKAEEIEHDFDQLTKGMEIKGVTQNEEHFKHYMQGMAKAVNVFGDTLRPTDYYEMFKYGRQATNPLSDKFMLETAPTFAQEMGGSSTGKALSTFYGTVIGGKMKDVAAKEFVRLGLADNSKIVRTKTGAVKGLLPNGISQGQLAASDPYAWVNDVMLPAMARKGITDPKKIQDEIAVMFRDSTAAQLVSILASQQARIEKDWKLVHEAKGLDASDDYLRRDPKVQMKAVGAQADNILSNTTAPLMPAVTGGLNWLVSGESWLAEHAKEKPGHTATAGAWLGGLSSALSYDAGMSTLAHLFGKGGTSWVLSKTMAALAPMLAITQLASDVVSDDDIRRLKEYEAGPRSRFDRLDKIDDEAAGDRATFREGSWLGEAQRQRRAARDAERARVETELEGFGYNPAVTAGRWRGPQTQWSVDDIRAVAGGGAPGAGNGEPVKAVVEGNATLETRVTINPSPSFLAQIEQKVTNAINAFRSSGVTASGSTGSTGRSSPDAAPAP